MLPRVEQPDKSPRPAGEDDRPTLLWHPLVVVPPTGTAAVTFTPGDAPAGYRVLVAGHTLDGRLGAAVGTVK